MLALATFVLPARVAEDHVSRPVIAPAQSRTVERVKVVGVVASPDTRTQISIRVATTGLRPPSPHRTDATDSRLDVVALRGFTSGPLTATDAPAVVSSSPAPVETPAPLTRTLPPSETPPSPTIAPAPIVVVAPEPTVSRADVAAVRAVLDRYQTAFSDLDARTAKAIWPSVDERALGRAFGQIQEQQIVFEACDVDVVGQRAAAACGGQASYVPRVGNKAARVEARRWAFTLRKTGDGWIIEAIELSEPSPLSRRASASPRLP